MFVQFNYCHEQFAIGCEKDLGEVTQWQEVARLNFFSGYETAMLVLSFPLYDKCAFLTLFSCKVI